MQHTDVAHDLLDELALIKQVLALLGMAGKGSRKISFGGAVRGLPLLILVAGEFRAVFGLFGLFHGKTILGLAVEPTRKSVLPLRGNLTHCDVRRKLLAAELGQELVKKLDNFFALLAQQRRVRQLASRLVAVEHLRLARGHNRERSRRSARIPGLDFGHSILGRHAVAVGEEIVRKLVEAGMWLHNHKLCLLVLSRHADERHNRGACQDHCGTGCCNTQRLVGGPSAHHR
mmetsp:Transcript_59686/g.96669  ORF Transcript_59686/g.96669 Transcript_59686/m.96669 type:complete len:231 (+) Transcript_59686:1406-2098(+)